MISLILLAISAIAKAVMDLCKINAFPDKFTWLNEGTSWRYKDTLEEKILGRQNDFLEWCFHTFLVWVTDGWHFFQMLFLNFIVAFIIVQFDVNPWWAIVITVGYKIVFQIFYSLFKLWAK